jgi:hypothetical protein
VTPRRPKPRLIVALLLAFAALAFPALAVSDDGGDPAQVVSALDAVPSVVDASSDAATTSDSDSAIVAQVNGATVDIPRDPSAGVTLTPTDALPVNVSVPGADQASDASTVDNGIVLYQNTGQSADVAVQVVPSSVLAAVPDATPADSTAPTDATTGTDTTTTSDTTTTTDTTTVTDTTSDPSAPADQPAPATDPQPGSSPAGPAADDSPSPAATVPDASAPTGDDSGLHLFSAADDSPAASSDAPGGVRMMTILQGPDSPTDYTFQLAVPGGGQIVETGDGGYLVEDSTGNSVAAVLAPWGRDGNGDAVPVTYTLDGASVTMHVDTTGAAFPIVADPAVIASAPAAKPAPSPAPAAPKADLSCTAVAAPWGGVSNGCSVSATLVCVFGPCTASEALTIYVDCRHCATGSLASKLAGIVKNAALWKVDGQCGTNCSEGAAREVHGTKWVAVTTWKYVAVKHCGYGWVLLGRILVLKYSCTVSYEKVPETTYVAKDTILHTCALRGAFSPAVLVPSGGDDLRYVIGASFSLSCSDTGGNAKVSLEARDSLTRLFFGS